MTTNKRSPRFALFYSFITEYISQALTLVSVIVLARILSPEEYGTYSLAMTMVLLFQHVTAFGVGQYVIKSHHLTDQQLRSAIGFTFLSSWMLGLVVLVIAPVASEFYAKQDIATILYILSIYFFLTPFAGVIEPSLKKELEYKLVAKVVLVSKSIQIPFTLFLAFQGYSYFSLAWGLVLEKALLVIFLNYQKPANLPVLPRFKQFGRVFRFGVKLTISGFSRQTRAGFSELIVGKFYSMEQVGYYSRALGALLLFSRMFTQAIINVLLPIFSREEREASGSSYLKAVALFTAFAFPFFGVMAVLADPIILVLYGKQWSESVSILRVFCLMGMMSSIYVFSTQKLLSKDGENELVYLEFIMLPLSVLILYLAAIQGMTHIVWARVLISVIEFFVVSRLIERRSGITILELFHAVAKSFGLALIVVTVTASFYEYLLAGYIYWMSLILSAVIAFVSWLIGIWLLQHALFNELKMLFNHAIKSSR